MKNLPLLLKDEFITNDISSMLEKMGFHFVEKHLNDYHYINQKGTLVVSVSDDEVLIMDRTLGEIPFIYCNTRYRKLDSERVERTLLAADISDNFNFVITKSIILKTVFRENPIEIEQTVESLFFPEEEFNRIFLDLRVRDGFSILKQFQELGISPAKSVTKKIRKLGKEEDLVYDESGNLINTISPSSISLDRPFNYRK